MNKPVFAMLVGGILGVFDGLSAWFYPDARPMIVGIVAGSTFKGVIAGLIIGLVAQRTQSMAAIVTVGIIGFLSGDQLERRSINNYWNVVPMMSRSAP